MYLNPIAAPMIDASGKPVEYDKKYLKDHFEEFYEDAFEELSKFGEIEELNVCDNVNEHLLGNVYIKYRNEDDAEKAVQALQVLFLLHTHAKVFHDPSYGRLIP